MARVKSKPQKNKHAIKKKRKIKIKQSTVKRPHRYRPGLPIMIYQLNYFIFNITQEQQPFEKSDVIKNQLNY